MDSDKTAFCHALHDLRAKGGLLEIGRDEDLPRSFYRNWILSQWNYRFRKNQLLDTGLALRLLAIEPTRLASTEGHFSGSGGTFVDPELKRSIILTRIPE